MRVCAQQNKLDFHEWNSVSMYVRIYFEKEKDKNKCGYMYVLYFDPSVDEIKTKQKQNNISEII